MYYFLAEKNRTQERQNLYQLSTGSSVEVTTGDVSDLGISFHSKTATQIVRGVSGINRVLYDVPTKPPTTIEWG